MEPRLCYVDDGRDKRKMTIFQVVWKQRWLLQECRNTFYYETTVGDPSDSEWGDIADEIRLDLDNTWKAQASVDWSFYAIDAREVSTAGLLSREFIPTLGTLVGTNAADSEATQIACLCSVKGLTTKPNRARTYMPGITQDGIIDSLVNSTVRTNLEALIDAQSALNSGGTNPLQRVAAQWNAGHTQVIVTNNIAGASSVASIVPAT